LESPLHTNNRHHRARARKKVLANQHSVAILFSTEQLRIFFNPAWPHLRRSSLQKIFEVPRMDKHVLFHSKADAARLIGISERMLHALISKKQLAIKRVGRRVLIAREELERFAQQGTCKKS
jgi:excisionase family DNA binding protein